MNAVFQSPCHCARLRAATRKVTQFYDSVLAPSGLKITQLSLLGEIFRRGENSPTMGELAQATVMDRSTLGHNLRPLQRDRLVKLVAGKADGRNRRVLLTTGGRERISQASELWQSAQRRFEAAVGVGSVSRLREATGELATMDFGADASS